MQVLLYFLLCSAVMAQTEIIDAKKSLHLIIEQMKQNSSTGGQFRLNKCPKINWADLLMISKKTELIIDFKDGCDIKGSIHPKFLSWFPIDLGIRNIPSYNRIKTNGLITAILEQKPIIKLEIKDGMLFGDKKTLGFEGNYQVSVTSSGEKTFAKNLGGEILITSLNGKKLSIKEKILIK